ncbi:MAG: oligopeptide/dipeptide ABC transporter ATP-binding protein, partial [Halobacteriales archaeon]
AAEPDLLVADEPTTGMDVTVQADVLSLLRDLRAEYGLGMLFVTHDMGVVADVADRVVVMYGGKVMERGPAAAIFDDPAHPYTRALFDCLPGRGDDTRPIEGSPPDPLDPPAGCRFHPRCPHAAPVCRHGGQPRFRDGPTEAACAFPEGVDR